MASLEDRARKARNAANEQFSGVSTGKTRDLVKQNAKAAGKKLTPTEEARAAKIMQTRRQNDRDRTAARAAFIAGPNSPRAKRATAANVAAGVSGAPKKAAVVKKASATRTTNPKAQVSSLERKMLANAKAKAAARKADFKRPTN